MVFVLEIGRFSLCLKEIVVSMEGSLALRALQLKAYAAAIDALRVSDPLSPNAQHLVESLKKTFKISEVRSFEFAFRSSLNRFSFSQGTVLKFAARVPTANCAKSSRKCADATAPPLGFVAFAERCQLQPNRLAWRPLLNANSQMTFSRRSRRRGRNPKSPSLFLRKILPLMICQSSKFHQSEAILNRKKLNFSSSFSTFNF